MILSTCRQCKKERPQEFFKPVKRRFVCRFSHHDPDTRQAVFKSPRVDICRDCAPWNQECSLYEEIKNDIGQEEFRKLFQQNPPPGNHESEDVLRGKAG